jgi:pimeloyl-ACP methyl ester carboxylesterase
MPLREINGVRCLVQESGRGELLVLVHGSWDSRDTWALVEDQLCESFRVLSFDRRGHSGSDPATGSRRDDEDDVAALIESTDGGRAHLVGSSFGASIALGVAARRPELVRSVSGHEPPLIGLVLDDPTVAATGQKVAQVVGLIDAGERESAARVFVEDVALGPGMWDVLPPENQERMVTNAETFVEEQVDPQNIAIDLDALAAFDGPVLLTKGDHSPPFFGAIIDRLDGAIDHVEVKTITGAGHLPHVTHPAEWLAVVTEFARAN